MKLMKEKYVLTEEDRVLLKKLSEPTHTSAYQKILMDSFDALIDEVSKNEQYPIMLMYLWISTARGITLREACEQFQINRDCGMSPVDPREALRVEYTITLEQREEPISISQHEFADYQMKVAKFLQDIIEAMNKRENNER
jgi:hypothetical protein